VRSPDSVAIPCGTELGELSGLLRKYRVISDSPVPAVWQDKDVGEPIC
jgi:hypothetical protein